MAFAFVLLLVSVPLTGGRLSRLSGVHVRLTWLIVLALAAQIVMTSVLADAPHALLIGLHGLSYVLIAWAIWVNRALPGLLLIALGGGTNAVVIALNGGTLPASASALDEAGFVVDPEQFKNSGAVEDPVLGVLGDIAATPAWLPFRNVISIGDVVVLLGAALMLHVTCRTWPYLAVAARRRRSPDLPGEVGEHDGADLPLDVDVDPDAAIEDGAGRVAVLAAPPVEPEPGVVRPVPLGDAAQHRPHRRPRRFGGRAGQLGCEVHVPGGTGPFAVGEPGHQARTGPAVSGHVPS